jgi:hypothetical protein
MMACLTIHCGRDLDAERLDARRWQTAFPQPWTSPRGVEPSRCGRDSKFIKDWLQDAVLDEYIALCCFELWLMGPSKAMWWLASFLTPFLDGRTTLLYSSH